METATINILIGVSGLLITLGVGILAICVTIVGGMLAYIINTINSTIKTGFTKSEQGDDKNGEEIKETKKLIDTAKTELRSEIKESKSENNKAVNKVENEMVLRREDVIGLHNKIDKRIDQMASRLDSLNK